MDPQKIAVPFYHLIGVLFITIIVNIIIRLIAQRLFMVTKKEHLNAIMSISFIVLILFAAQTGYIFAGNTSD